MTEEYLHFIWGVKRIIATELKTQIGESIHIKNAGLHNDLLAGPDFSHATLMIDGIEWHGPVEIHIKSSDWYRHKHHLDSAYNNVILHVVYEHDTEIIQDGRQLPTLELKQYIDWQHFETFKKFQGNKHEVACAKGLEEIDPLFVSNMMTKALVTKWNEKVRVISEYIEDPDDAMYYFLGAAFGGHLNVHPFLQTLAAVPVSRLRKLTPMKRYNWLVTQSGMIHGASQAKERWHLKGNRPHSFPSKRLFQFAYYMHDEQLKLLTFLAHPKEVIERFEEIMQPQSEHIRLSANFKNQLIINGIVPFFNYCSNKEQEVRYQDFAMDLLRSLPPENNNITRKWAKIGLAPKNAFESQGLLALYRYHCEAKKCLSCEVGNAIISK